MHCSIGRKVFLSISSTFLAPKKSSSQVFELHRKLRKQFLMLSVAAKIWRKCTQLWQLLQHYKPKFLEKNSANYWWIANWIQENFCMKKMLVKFAPRCNFRWERQVEKVQKCNAKMHHNKRMCKWPLKLYNLSPVP